MLIYVPSCIFIVSSGAFKGSSVGTSGQPSGAPSAGSSRPGPGPYSFVACISHLTSDHASLSRRSIVPTPDRDTSNI